MSELGRSIEAESFRQIEALLAPALAGPVREVYRRIIHATADPGYAERLQVHPGLIEAFRTAAQAGAAIYVDVQMLRAGIQAALLPSGRVHCQIGEPAVRELADTAGLTRAAAAFRLWGRGLEGQIIAIGNAPTALREVSRLVREGLRPAAIIGVPVGFVDAADSKAELAALDIPFLTARGPQGGTPVAASAVNALLRLR